MTGVNNFFKEYQAACAANRELEIRLELAEAICRAVVTHGSVLRVGMEIIPLIMAWKAACKTTTQDSPPKSELELE